MSNNTHSNHIAFIGGGNMASAIIGGLLKQGLLPAQIQVIEPFEAQRLKLVSQFGIEVHAAPSDSLLTADLLVWAVKPQMFREAALHTRSHCPKALHLSVAAGVRSDSIAHWLDSQSIVRAMPNTPALVGKGMTALYARNAVTLAQKLLVDSVISTTGAFLWLDDETQLDAVTALSGSGPAYVFYFIESMVEAGVQMGLSAAQAQQLAIGTFVGASELASTSSESPQILRERVTSKGGTTHAALNSMEQDDVKALFIRAMQAAKQRAAALGDEFGKP